MAAREVACFERGVLFVLGYYFVIYIVFLSVNLLSSLSLTEAHSLAIACFLLWLFLIFLPSSCSYGLTRFLPVIIVTRHHRMSVVVNKCEWNRELSCFLNPRPLPQTSKCSQLLNTKFVLMPCSVNSWLMCRRLSCKKCCRALELPFV